MTRVILNSVLEAPTRHFGFDDDGITTDIEQKCRSSALFMPIARAKKKGEQAHFDFCKREAVEPASYLPEVAARWAAVEVTAPWDSVGVIRGAVAGTA